MANPDAAKWTNPVTDANAYWAEEAATSYYYSAIIDSANDAFTTCLYSSTAGAAGTCEFAKFDPNAPVDTSAADALGAAAWKIAIALTNLIPCDTPMMGPDCSSL